LNPSQQERLEQVFKVIGKRARAKTCAATEGLIKESQEMMEAFAGFFHTPSNHPTNAH
jgi:ferritin-like metal-binding protein YciE